MKERDAYGALGTGVWFLVVVVVFNFIQLFAIGVFVGVTQGVSTPEQIEASMFALQFDGNAVAWATTASGIICSALIILAVKFSKSSLGVCNYLGLIAVSKSVYIWWGVFFAFVLLLSEGISYLLGKTIPREMR